MNNISTKKFSLLVVLLFWLGLSQLTSSPKISIGDTDRSSFKSVDNHAEMALHRTSPRSLQDREELLKVAQKLYKEWKAQESLVPNSDIPSWVSIGPTNGSGKMGPIVPHPSVTGTLFAAADGGGLWKTIDNGKTWIPLTDGLSFLVTTALAVSRSAPNTIYLGTDGLGIVRSTDGGSNWSFLNSSLALAGVPHQISVHTDNANELLVASYGAFKSTNAGDTWKEVIPGSVYGVVTDIVREQDNAQIVYAAASSADTTIHVLKSTDGGESWAQKDNGCSVRTGSGLSYIRVALSRSNPQVLYASTAIASGQPSSNRSHIFKTTDGGESWIDLQAVAGNSDSSISGYLIAPWRNQALIVSPTDSNTVFAGGLTYIRSTDGGATWQHLPLRDPDVHVDACDMQYQDTTLWIANDGGIWSSADNGLTAVNHNAGLVSREYYTLAMDPVDPNGLILAGSQDNGIDMRATGGSGWQQVFFGDGAECIVNPDNPAIAYASLAAQGTFRTQNAGAPDMTWVHVTFPTSSIEDFHEAVQGIAYFGGGLVLDPNIPLTAYAALGFSRVVRSTDAGNSWQFLPTTTTDGSVWDTSLSATVSEIAIAPYNSSVILVSKFQGTGNVLYGFYGWRTHLALGFGICSETTDL